MKKVILTEEQEKMLIDRLNEEVYQMPVPKQTGAPYCINPDNVLTVKHFMDNTFKKGTYEDVINGFPKKIRVAQMIASTGEPLGDPIKDDVLHSLLAEKFKNMFIDKIERELFFKQFINDWFNDKISVFGGLSVNCLK